MAPHRRHPHRRRRPVLVPVSLLVTVAGLATAAALGGLEEAPDPAPKRLGKGDVFDQARIRTKFEDAVVLPGGRDGVGIQGQRWLHVRLQVTNQSDETVQAFGMVDRTIPTVRADGKTIKSPDQNFTDGPRIVMYVNERSYNQIHPGVTAPVTMAFELSPTDPPPKKVELDVGRFHLFESFFWEVSEWQIESDTVPAGETPDNKARSVTRVHAKVELPVRVEEGS
ncbi:hypothetical protein [Thermopolyspora flexuosa]|uniref:DUF4352 domain-containing protein n=1 Tax=Thermopolyspora flexuosa TaxID=103836 RepID=A0A543J2Y6_9ACTN|nr:hypothetical protein [Thermopolyspora flexuosa]TQM77187.1 hypothetical protein FHX40_3943 [Thermopolyspora flexuosa]